VKVETLEQLAR